MPLLFPKNNAELDAKKRNYLGGHISSLLRFGFSRYAAHARRDGGGGWNTKSKKTDLMGPTSNRS
jgi:hypothetical protein